MQSSSSVQPRKGTAGYPLSLLAAFFLALTGVLIRKLSVDFLLPTFVLALWRNVFTAAILALALLIFRPGLLIPGRSRVGFLLSYGAVLALFNLSWTYSIQLNGATIATVLVYTSTIFTIFLDRIFHHEPITPGGITAAAVSLVGCSFVAELGFGSWSGARIGGLLVGLVSGFAFGIYSVTGREASRRGLNSWTTVSWIFAVSAAMILAADLILGVLAIPGTGAPLFLGDQLAGWGLLLILAAGPTLLGYGFYTAALVHLPGAVVNLIATLEPVFTAVVAYFYLAERITPLQGAGSLLILTAVLIVRSERNHSPATSISARLRLAIRKIMLTALTFVTITCKVVKRIFPGSG